MPARKIILKHAVVLIVSIHFHPVPVCAGQTNIPPWQYPVVHLNNAYKHVYNPLHNVMLSIHKDVVEVLVQVIFLPVDVNVVRVFTIRHRDV